jgi:hypothetical protein
MPLIEFNWNPTVRQLRQFAGLCLFTLPALGYLWKGSWPVIGGLAAVGGLLTTLGLVAPALIRPLFLGLSFVTIPIGMVISELAIATIFYGVLMPLAIFFRLLGRDALRLRIDRNASSYWLDKKQPKNGTSYYRQF